MNLNNRIDKLEATVDPQQGGSCPVCSSSEIRVILPTERAGKAVTSEEPTDTECPQCGRLLRRVVRSAAEVSKVSEDLSKLNI